MTAYAWYVRGAEHAALCRTSIESVCKVNPYARVIVMTDDDLTSLYGYAEIHSLQKRGQPIMLANLDAQVEALFVALSGGESDVVFLDTDVLLRGKIHPVGDITVTWRDHALVGEDGEKIEAVAGAMPYNYGVMAARVCQNSIEAFIWLRERIRRMHSTHQLWFGNQLAMAALAGAPPKSGSSSERRRIPWTLTSGGREINIGKIPCDIYNYTPRAAGESLGGKAAIHFKGQARPLMKQYALDMGIGWYL